MWWFYQVPLCYVVMSLNSCPHSARIWRCGLSGDCSGWKVGSAEVAIKLESQQCTANFISILRETVGRLET